MTRDRNIHELLTDPDVRGLLDALARRQPPTRPGQHLCPDCTARWIPNAHDQCPECQRATERRARDRKARWWHKQDDYQTLRTEHGALGGATRWIVHQLRRGPVPAADVQTAALEAGISPRTFERARGELNAEGRITITRHGNGPDHHAVWHLTPDQ